MINILIVEYDVDLDRINFKVLEKNLRFLK